MLPASPSPLAGSSADYKPLKQDCKAEGGGFGTASPKPEALQLDGCDEEAGAQGEEKLQRAKSLCSGDRGGSGMWAEQKD